VFLNYSYGLIPARAFGFLSSVALSVRGFSLSFFLKWQLSFPSLLPWQLSLSPQTFLTTNDYCLDESCLFMSGRVETLLWSRSGRSGKMFGEFRVGRK
jgi:hypothetical protein